MQDIIGILAIVFIIVFIFVFEPVVDKLLDGIGDTEVSEGITAQEFKVGCLIAKGCSDKEICEKLFISATTLKFHIQHLREKLGLSHSGIDNGTMRVRIALKFMNEVTEDIDGE